MAERDAQAAAMQAFARAKERSSTADTSPWPPPRYHGTFSANSPGSVRDPVESSPALRRQQSVRFMRPRPPPVPRANTAHGELTPTPSLCTGRRGYENSSFASGMASAAKGTAGDYINALITSEEYYTPEDDIASAPSSYRRVRKSRSMLISSEPNFAAGLPKERRTLTTTTNGFPVHSRNTAPRSDENRRPTGLRAPKSMSFLKAHQDHSRSQLNVPESTSFSSKPAGVKGFKKSLRDVGNGATSLRLKIPKDGSLRNKARKTSFGLKHKFRTMFTFGREETDDIAFPPQQIPSRMSRSGENESIADHVDDIFRPNSPTDACTMSRVNSGLPSLHTVPSYQQLRSHQGSLESLNSERNAGDEKSRVTSWSNSDTNTATTATNSGRDWERQRLSVIKENGVHVSSSSAKKRTRVLDTFVSQSTSTPPTPRSPSSPPQSHSTISGQRVSSALMKRVNGKRRQSQYRGAQDTGSAEDDARTEIIPPRGSSYSVQSWRLGTPSTIRRVVANNNSDYESVGTTGTVINASRIRGSRNNSPVQSGLDKEGYQENDPRLYSSVISSVGQAYGDELGDARPFTAPCSEEQHKVQPQSLSARTSAFFGSPMCHLFRTKSPYRRTLQGSMREATKTPQPKSPEFNPWMQSLSTLPLRCPNTGDSAIDPKMQYAESIYSCDAEIPRHASYNIVQLGGDSQRPPSPPGHATIFVAPNVYRPSAPATPSLPKERITSTNSSAEWKAWLSANMSKLEGPAIQADGDGVRQDEMVLSPLSRHVREKTQITDDSDGEGPEELNVYKPTRVDSKTPSSEQSKPVTYLPRPLPKSGAETSSDKENETAKPPPVPVRNVLRTAPSSTSIGSGPGKHGINVETIPKYIPLNVKPQRTPTHMRSLNALQGNQPRERHYPSKLPRKQDRPTEHAGPMSSPGIAAAVDQQFGAVNDSTSAKSPAATVRLQKRENVSPRVGSGKSMNDAAAVTGTGTAALGPETSPDHRELGMGSKKMVEMFLSSRRRRMASSNDDRSVFL